MARDGNQTSVVQMSRLQNYELEKFGVPVAADECAL